MLSLNIAANTLRLLGDLNFPAISLPVAVAVNPGRRRRRQRPQPAVCVHLDSFSFRIADLKRSRHHEGSWCCWCKVGWESEGDSAALEAEILEFMDQSKNPEAFPTKKELVDAGRMDLAEGIMKKGGWLSLGWDLGNEEEEEEEEAQEIDITARQDARMDADCDDCVLREFQQRVEGYQERNSFEISTSSCSPSSSDISLEMVDEQETGIGGILARLEKQRNLSFGINLGENGYSATEMNKYGEDVLHIGASKDADSADIGRSRGLKSDSPNNGIIDNSGGKFSLGRSVSDFDGSRSSLKPEMWRTWSIQRAGFLDSEFEAAEIPFNDYQMHEGRDTSKTEMLSITDVSIEALDRQKDIGHNDIRTRLQHLELELASALRLLKSKSEDFAPKEGHETSNKELWNLSDASEFQENEIMNAQDRLRSIRAKLAVLEGKMALSIIDAQKIVEEKKNRIDGARKALQLLRTTRIVWPNSASEVLVAGSFDGWTTQRKMEKSSTGIFSVCMKLYPGRYEIKFIVDGIWRTDPLRPIVHNGHENNLLIVT